MATKQEIKELQQELQRLRNQFGELEPYELVGKKPAEQAKELNALILEYKNTLEAIEDSWGNRFWYY